MFAFYRSTIGKKVVVALTGAVLVGFVFGHMIGNLKAFMGHDQQGLHKLDHYAHFLREMGESLFGYGTLLWLVRIGLIISVVLHIVTVIQLSLRNRSARKVSYVSHSMNSATLASRFMTYGGVILFVFIIFHILHLTTGDLHFQGYVEGNVYANVVRAFQQWYNVCFYLVAMVALCAHLYHGIWSLFQTLGLDNPVRNRYIRTIAVVVAVVVSIGFISVPIAVFFNVLREGSTVALLMQ